VVWAHRGAGSIFGAASHPVRLNGGLLCFKTEDKARSKRDQLNARSGNGHVRYSVRPIHVHMERPDGIANGAGPMPPYAVPPARRPLPGLAAARLA
jgi:hypothetical protein